MRKLAAWIILGSVLTPVISVRAQECVLALPAKVPAFEAIEKGIRRELGSKAILRVVLATDYKGEPGGIVEAANASKPFCVLPLGTTMSRSFLAAGETKQLPPLLCVAVSNPADVLPPDQLAVPRKIQATVITDAPHSIFPDTADLIGKLFPKAKRLGTVFNPGEANSLSNRQWIAEQAKRKGWALIEKSVNGPEDVEVVARALLEERPDVIWISKDRVMTTQPERLIELAHARGVPVFCSDSGTVEAFGAFGTKSVSFEDLGAYIGEKVLEVLAGKSVQEMPISTIQETKAFLSRAAIAQLKLELPPDVAATSILVGASEPMATKGDGSMIPWVLGGAIAIIILLAILVLWSKRHATAP